VTAALRQGGLHPDAKAPIVAFVATRRGLGHGGGHCGIEKSFWLDWLLLWGNFHLSGHR